MEHSTPKPEFYGMPYTRLGKSGLWASKVGLGTWKFGCPETGDEARVDQPTAILKFIINI